MHPGVCVWGHREAKKDGQSQNQRWWENEEKLWHTEKMKATASWEANDHVSMRLEISGNAH